MVVKTIYCYVNFYYIYNKNGVEKIQTFLPYSSFVESAKVLDRQRLGKQRCESYQILKVLLGIGKRNKNGNLAWSNHPAVKMWKGYELSLYYYTTEIIGEWKSRGYKDTVQEKINELVPYFYKQILIIPDWLNEEFCTAHKSNLIRKLPEHYKQLWPDVPDNLPYIWPI